MKKTFLKANWENLIMANYEVDPSLLKPYLPKGGYFTQSLPAFQRKVYHPKGGVEAFSNLVNFFGS